MRSSSTACCRCMGLYFIHLAFHLVQRTKKPVCCNSRSEQKDSEGVPSEHVPPGCMRAFDAQLERLCFELLRDPRHPDKGVNTLKRRKERDRLPDGFYYHLGLHYSQTLMYSVAILAAFYYHLGLHYSQTIYAMTFDALQFYYHLGLHYSQTRPGSHKPLPLFYYHLGLHYSQTRYP